MEFSILSEEAVENASVGAGNAIEDKDWGY
jgi:hypothetical protein